MNQRDDEKVLTMLDQTLADAGNASASGADRAPDDYSTESMDFCGITALILDHTEDVFALTRVLDKNSSQYLKTCKVLVKAVDHLGSAFLTKTAMIQRGFDVSGLEPLTAERLNQMISCNARKVDDALRIKKQKDHELDTDLFELLLTFANTMGRLRSTQYRSYSLNLCLDNPDKLAEKALSFTKEDGNRKHAAKHSTNAPFRDFPSYPVRVDAIMGNQKSEIRDQKSDENEEVRTKNEEMAGENEEVVTAEMNEKGPEDSAASASADQHSSCHREQLSKKASNRRVAEEIAEYEVSDPPGEMETAMPEDDEIEKYLNWTDEQEQKIFELTEPEQDLFMDTISSQGKISQLRNCINDPMYSQFYPDRVVMCRHVLETLALWNREK